jgi:hypothetical protein
MIVMRCTEQRRQQLSEIRRVSETLIDTVIYTKTTRFAQGCKRIVPPEQLTIVASFGAKISGRANAQIDARQGGC